MVQVSLSFSPRVHVCVDTWIYTTDICIYTDIEMYVIRQRIDGLTPVTMHTALLGLTAPPSPEGCCGALFRQEEEEEENLA